MNRTLRIVAIVLGSLLGLWFLLAGAQKFLSAAAFEAMFGELGLPLALVPLIGVLEIGAAILVLIPRTSLYGASLIVLIMLGAVGSHLVAGMTVPVAAFVALVMSAAVVALRLRGRGALRG